MVAWAEVGGRRHILGVVGVAGGGSWGHADRRHVILIAGPSWRHRHVIIWGGDIGRGLGVARVAAGGGEPTEGWVGFLRPVVPHRIVASLESLRVLASAVPVVREVRAGQLLHVQRLCRDAWGHGGVGSHALHVCWIVGAVGGVEVAEGA